MPGQPDGRTQRQASPGPKMSRAENATAAVARTPRRFWNVPNSLTVSRLVLAVAVYGLIEFQAYAWALAVFLVAAATDALDGYFARLLKQESPLGRQLDPLIDKVIVAGCYIYLTTIPDTGVRPWMVTAIVVRELLIQGLRSLIEGRASPSARTAGKLKTVVQCASISAVLLVLWLQSSSPPFLAWVRDGLTWLAVALTIYSGLVYIRIAMPSLRRAVLVVTPSRRPVRARRESGRQTRRAVGGRPAGAAGAAARGGRRPGGLRHEPGRGMDDESIEPLPQPLCRPAARPRPVRGAPVGVPARRRCPAGRTRRVAMAPRDPSERSARPSRGRSRPA